MAGLSQVRGRWVVSWGPRGQRKQKVCRTEADAFAFMAENDLRLARRGGKGRARNRAQVIDHLASSFEVDGNDCWVWTGRLTNAGYAALTWKQDGIYPIPGAHRVVLHAIGQPVPRGLVVDHLCRNRACINPDHLDVVSQRENVMRSPIAPGALNAAKTHCTRGHEYTPDNTYVWTSTTRSTTVRVCRTCQRDHARRRSVLRKKGAAA